MKIRKMVKITFVRYVNKKINDGSCEMKSINVSIIKI
jgi:hypothetical protein